MQKHVFIKAEIPQERSEKMSFARKLMKYGVSLTEYGDALKQADYVSAV